MARYILLAILGLWLGLWVRGVPTDAHGPTTIMALDDVTGAPVFITTDGSNAISVIGK